MRLFAYIRCPHCDFWLVAAYHSPDWFCTACGSLVSRSIIRDGLKYGRSIYEPLIDRALIRRFEALFVQQQESKRHELN